MSGLPPEVHSQLTVLALAGLVAGVLLFIRGLAAYRSGADISAIATSTVASAAAGEVRITGHVRPAAITLVSPLQSRRCVFYRARITESVGDTRHEILHEERGVGFFVDDGSGAMRVLPAGARWMIPESFGGMTSVTGDDPPGLAVNDGPASVATEADREAAIHDLLTVHAPDLDPDFIRATSGPGVGLVQPRRTYSETILEPGATVTVIGTAVPFGALSDPASADEAAGSVAALDDPEIEADLAMATASGSLAATPAEAWGNAAIPGFGIGKPVRAPLLDPAAHREPVADAGTARKIEALFEIAADTLVLAVRPDAPLTVYAGTPAEAEGRARSTFLLGVLGATLAIASAVVLAILVTGL